MLTQQQYDHYRRKAVELIENAKIIITPEEKQQVEIADFGLGQFEQTGLAVLVYVNTDRVCAKELALLPFQTCPEHRHPTVEGILGKEETFRVRWGKMFLYVPGDPQGNPQAKPPVGKESAFTVWHEIELNAGEQYTLAPNTLHWFQGGPEGAVVSEFSTRSTDENDIFTDEEIFRFTRIE